jgi:CheY-like chemotaxis protein
MRVIIIDDDMIFRMIASRMLKFIDASVTIEEQENALMALESLEEQMDGVQKVVILLDINMPITNGWDFLDQMMLKSFFKQFAPSIYIVSSSTDEIDLMKAKKYNFLKGFVHKPLSKEDILSILSDCPIQPNL